MKQIKNRITVTITQSGEGNTVKFLNNPSLMDLAICANIIDAAMINNFPLEDIEQAKDKAWMQMADIEEVRR